MGAPERTRAVADSLGIGRGQRHVFLCAQQTKPKCAGYEETTEVWKFLKRRLRELGLEAKALAEDPEAACVHRSKVDCLRVCVDGPIAVVYPDGTWYHSVTTEAMERILQEHVIGGRAVEDLLIRSAPLSANRD